jgi:hypothetical protein
MSMDVRRFGVVLMAVVAAAACSSGSPGRVAYLRQSAAACPAVDELTRQRSADPLPAGFRPVSAIRCTFQLLLGQVAPSSSAGFAWAVAQRSTGPFDDLVRVLHLPPPEHDGELACPAVFIMPVLLALTDAAGRTLVPALPGTVCGTPLPEVGSALDALSWVEIAHAR